MTTNNTKPNTNDIAVVLEGCSNTRQPGETILDPVTKQAVTKKGDYTQYLRLDFVLTQGDRSELVDLDAAGVPTSLSPNGIKHLKAECDAIDKPVNFVDDTEYYRDEQSYRDSKFNPKQFSVIYRPVRAKMGKISLSALTSQDTDVVSKEGTVHSVPFLVAVRRYVMSFSIHKTAFKRAIVPL